MKKPKVSKIRTALVVQFFIIALLMISLAYVYGQSGNTFIITSGIYPSADSYTIYKEDSTYYAKNSYGAIDYSGTNVSVVYANSQTAISTSGGTIKFKKGTYPIQIGDLISNLRLIGEKNAILQLPNGANTHIISSDLALSNVHIEGLVFDGNGLNQVSQASRNDLELIQISNTTNLKFIGNTVKHTRDGAGLNIWWSSKVEIRNNLFEENGWISGSGSIGSFATDHIHLGGNVFVHVVNNHFQHCTDTALASDNNQWDIYSENTFQGYCSQFMTLYSADTSYFKSQSETMIEVSDNVFQGEEYNTEFLYNNFAHILISNTTAETIPTDLDISDNIMYYGEYGIYLAWGTKINIDGNHILYSENAGIGTEYAVNVQIEGNFFTSNNVGIKINVVGTDTSNLNVIGNHFYDDTYSPLWLVSTPLNFNISRNFGYATENFGSVSGTSPITVTHKLGHANETITPKVILITSKDVYTNSTVQNVGTTTFQIAFDVGGVQVFYWYAEGKPT